MEGDSRRLRRCPLCDHAAVEPDRQLLRAWQDAADDLGIEVAPAEEAVLVRGFGSVQGMICAMPESVEERDLRRRAEAHGCGWSVLGPSYLRYDRQAFIETLNDWGWCGGGSPPPWYTGEPWTA